MQRNGGRLRGRESKTEGLDECAGKVERHIGWLQAVGSLKLYVSFAKEPYKRDYILQKRPSF